MTESATTQSSKPPQSPTRSLANLPVSAFAMTMGLGGLAISWKEAATLGSLPASIPSAEIAQLIADFALAVYALTFLAYLAKLIRHPKAVAEDFTHPVKVAFTATIPLSLLVLSAAYLGIDIALSQAFWWIGAAGLGLISLWVVRTWIVDSTIEQVHVHPAWFIPAVGNLVAPIAGVEYAPDVANWYFFGIGVVYFVALLPLVFARLFTAHSPLAPRLLPTLAILIAPPAVGAIAWTRLGGEWDDPIVKILLGAAAFQLLLLVIMIPRLRHAPFSMSYWAYSFPLAALSSALFGSEIGDGLSFGIIAVGLFALTNLVILVVLIRTIVALARGEIFREE